MSQEGLAGIRRLILAFVAVVVVLSFIPGSGGLIDLATKLFASALVGAIFSLIAATIVEAFTGDHLKNILLSFEVDGFEFSVSLFFVATLVVRVLLFR